MAKSNEILISIRKITREIDLHSNKLTREYNLTGPQLTLCSALIEHQQLTVSELARAVYLSKATVVSILDRLSTKGYIDRRKDHVDKRKVFVTPTAALRRLFDETAPNLLQEKFSLQFERLKPWEQSLILSSFERVADMMHADE